MAMRRGMSDLGLSPLLIEEGCRRRRRGGMAAKTTPALRATPPWKGGENKCALNITHYSSAPPELRRIAIFPPQFLGSLSFLPPAAALFRRFNSRHGPKRASHEGIQDGSFKRQVQGASDRRRFSRHAVRHVLYRRRYGIGSLGLCDADGGRGARGTGRTGARAGRAREGTGGRGAREGDRARGHASAGHQENPPRRIW